MYRVVKVGRPRFREFGSPTHFTVESWAGARPDLDPSAYLFLIHVARLGRLIERLHDRYCRAEFGLSGADVNILIILRRTQTDHAPRPAELAESQMVTTGAVAKQLDRLEGLGYVERKPYQGKGGGVAIFATNKGIDLAERAMSAMVGESPLGAMGRYLSAKERETLVRQCEKLLLKFENA